MLARSALVLPPLAAFAWFISSVTENGPGCGPGTSTETALYAIDYCGLALSAGGMLAALAFAVGAIRLRWWAGLLSASVGAFVLGAVVYYTNGCAA